MNDNVFAENYWLWVTQPRFYLVRGHDGYLKERSDLDPNFQYSRTDDWWTCHKDTKKGDLILLYRAKRKKDIKYLFRATSDARENNEDYNEPGWDYICNFESLYKFNNPIKLNKLRKTQELHDWGAYKANFNRQVYPIPDYEFAKLIEILEKKNDNFRKFIETIGSLKRQIF